MLIEYFSIDFLILILALCGFLVAVQIRRHKVKNKPLVCMVGFDCHAVVHSDYSKFLGIPVEILGMIYYAVIFVFYSFVVFWRGVIPDALFGFIFLFSLSAFVFSLYLIMVQIFVLRKGCSWCIVSALISALIFGLSVIK